jgi:carbonic anhydrase
MQAHETGVMPGGYVRHIVELVTLSTLSAARAGRVTVDEVVAEHTQQTAQLLADRSAAIADRIADGRCAIVAMEYTLAEGEARLLTTIGDAGKESGHPAA